MDRKVFASSISTLPHGIQAIHEVSTKIREGLQDASCDLALVFFSESFGETPARLMLDAFREEIKPAAILACNASGVIGDDREVEMQPAISAIAMHLPGVKITPFSFSPVQIEAVRTGADMLGYLDLFPTDDPKFICLADPVLGDPGKILNLLNEGFPAAPVVGGLASGSIVNASNWLFINGEMQEGGAAGVALTGDVVFETCVSQGCRPIGEPLAVTRAEKNILYELGGKPPLDAFRELYRKLSPQDQMLAQSALFVGLAMDENQTSFSRGDFLIRNIVGVDQQSGALSIGAYLQPGQTMQFQLRDAQASQEDLEILLKQMPPRAEGAEGALLISCCGRGRGLYGEEDHDIRVIQKHRGPLTLTGFFAGGEFGPVKGRNYIHGYTSSLTVIR